MTIQWAQPWPEYLAPASTSTTGHRRLSPVTRRCCDWGNRETRSQVGEVSINIVMCGVRILLKHKLKVYLLKSDPFDGLQIRGCGVVSNLSILILGNVCDSHFPYITNIWLQVLLMYGDKCSSCHLWIKLIRSWRRDRSSGLSADKYVLNFIFESFTDFFSDKFSQENIEICTTMFYRNLHTNSYSATIRYHDYYLVLYFKS